LTASRPYLNLSLLSLAAPLACPLLTSIGVTGRFLQQLTLYYTFSRLSSL